MVTFNRQESFGPSWASSKRVLPTKVAGSTFVEPAVFSHSLGLGLTCLGAMGSMSLGGNRVCLLDHCVSRLISRSDLSSSKVNAGYSTPFILMVRFPKLRVTPCISMNGVPRMQSYLSKLTM